MTAPENATDFLRISVPRQCLELIEAGRVVARYRVSTAKNGVGEKRGSECTPRGWHRVRAKIGAGLPPGTVLVGRRPTGEIHTPELAARHPGRDWILSRILWLGGLQPGFNRYGEVDTAWRYIYIHGSPDAGVDGTPQSHGCIRLTSADVIDLFDRVPAGELVYIDADA
ncbi:L,D-transpeptidase [Methylococcus mesophilus]|uniref:L,D-transpeptidase n=1 Tax=Methylococcus mesophilus TaxID=2993564 RepID=UPI00224A7E28|nr:L,D-transpeptidase [Methylococcus mesophilus]UZR29985.1 L,D-transpeptidase [Methylococcus mesophilus]